MGNAVSILHPNAGVIRTREGAIALRQMTSSGAWRVDSADLPDWITPSVRAALPAAIEEATALNAAAMGRDFKRLLVPILVLVASAGMTADESRTWQAAAAEALRGIPADLMEMGCAVARRTCDHPSKIVPTILKTVGGAWEDRRTDLAKLKRIAMVADQPIEQPEAACTPEEAAEILRASGFGHVVRDREQKDAARPARAVLPLEDHNAHGLSREEAEQALADHTRMMSRGKARSFGQAAEASVHQAAGR